MRLVRHRTKLASSPHAFMASLCACNSAILPSSLPGQHRATSTPSSGTTCAMRRIAMLGTIRGRHLLTHGPLIVRLFGFRAYLRCVACLLKRRRQGHATFLGALQGSLLN